MTVRRIARAAQVQTGTLKVDMALDGQRQSLNDLHRRPIAKALIKTTLYWGLNKVAHGLGERPVAWHVTFDTLDATATDCQAENPFPAKELWVYLLGVASAGAMIWVY